jgi:hypothetical protein
VLRGTNIGWLLRSIAAKAAKDAKVFLLALLRLRLWGQLRAAGKWVAAKGLLY